MIFQQDFTLEPEGLLAFSPNIIHPEPDIRRLRDAAPVLKNQLPLDDRPLYYMYREVTRQGDEKVFREHNLRYDITILVPGLLGDEFIKTVGHFHPLKPHSSETYPEYYEVLYGEAIYLLQKNDRASEAEEVIAVRAKKGDKVYIPPNYGHVTINPGETHLVMANLVERNFKSIYEPFAEKRGAAYYYIQVNDKKNDFVKNPAYSHQVALKMVGAPSLPAPVEGIENQGLYEAFLKNPEGFKFLV